ncbi:rhoptry kinase family protein ROP32 [Besnoitia besnoiti]|uniref:Rhoptry kinase family protein ROP32 n=1 Tax=Besnoitia besnoiti TaxID=94643 RepID=A0A2A9MK05_BESBE|nr:rhoptry kinase family protein ROP32 [Besnoitia besnoiti]PFH35740.1 rhoptry kinase family protein ROP32 [Besnoitia besnoiti]
MAAVRQSLFWRVPWTLYACSYLWGLLLPTPQSVLLKGGVRVSADSVSHQRLSHSSPSVFLPCQEADYASTVESVESHIDAKASLLSTNNIRSRSLGSEGRRHAVQSIESRATAKKSHGLRSVYTTPERHAVDSRLAEWDRYARQNDIGHDEYVAETREESDTHQGVIADADPRARRDEDFSSALLRTGYYTAPAIEIPSDPEAVKELADMVATTNTHELVSHSRKKDLIATFNFYLPPDEPFSVESPSEEFSPKEFVRGRLLGVGGNGLVFEAQDSEESVYALKLLLIRMKTFLAAVGDRGEMAWKLEESRSFSRALHKEMKILSIFPPDKTADQLYEEGFVLPLFQGVISGKPRITPLTEEFGATSVVVGFHKVACSVGQLVGAHRLHDRVKMELTRQMIGLLARLHSYEILHADVKWENFFLDAHGHVFLGDFEQSQVLGQGKTAPCGPRGGGTPSLHEPARAACYFGDPERRLTLLASRDSWSLGVILYKLWCSRFPFGLRFTPGDVPRYMKSVAAIARDGLVADFDSCPASSSVPGDVKELIAALLYHDWHHRETPLSLISKSPVFQRPTSEKTESPTE